MPDRAGALADHAAAAAAASPPPGAATISPYFRVALADRVGGDGVATRRSPWQRTPVVVGTACPEPRTAVVFHGTGDCLLLELWHTPAPLAPPASAMPLGGGDQPAPGDVFCASALVPLPPAPTAAETPDPLFRRLWVPLHAAPAPLAAGSGGATSATAAWGKMAGAVLLETVGHSGFAPAATPLDRLAGALQGDGLCAHVQADDLYVPSDPAAFPLRDGDKAYFVKYSFLGHGEQARALAFLLLFSPPS